MEIKVLVDCKTILGEGPLWDVESQRIYWIDSFGMKVYRATPAGTEIETWKVPSKIGSLAIRRDGGGAIVALQTGFHALDFRTGECPLVHDPEANLPGTRLNDGKVDRRGRFLAGSMDMQEDGPSGSLYRLDPDFSVHRLESGIVCSNGPCWSPDGRTFYFADTWSNEISAYDYDLETGTPNRKRCFASYAGMDGAPDGATVDEEGYVWSAAVYAGKLHRFAPDGTLDRTVAMPVLKVTSMSFGGSQMDVLFVTSMAKPPLPRFPEDGPLGGSVFAIQGLGVRGLPEPRFGA